MEATNFGLMDVYTHFDLYCIDQVLSKYAVQRNDVILFPLFYVSANYCLIIEQFEYNKIIYVLFDMPSE